MQNPIENIQQYIQEPTNVKPKRQTILGKFVHEQVIVHDNGKRYPKDMTVANTTMNRHERKKLAKKLGITWEKFKKWEQHLKLNNSMYIK